MEDSPTVAVYVAAAVGVVALAFVLYLVLGRRCYEAHRRAPRKNLDGASSATAGGGGGGTNSGSGGISSGSGNLSESLAKKKDMSYYYAHSRGNKSSDVDITKIGEKGGYGIGAPPLISRTPSRGGSSTVSDGGKSGGGVASGSTESALKSPKASGSATPAAAAAAAPLRSYSWEDSGKFIKIHVDLPAVPAPASGSREEGQGGQGDPAVAAAPWSHQVESTATSLLLLLEHTASGARHKLHIPVRTICRCMSARGPRWR
jgi:hypothetical protein